MGKRNQQVHQLRAIQKIPHRDAAYKHLSAQFTNAVIQIRHVSVIDAFQDFQTVPSPETSVVTHAAKLQSSVEMEDVLDKYIQKL